MTEPMPTPGVPQVGAGERLPPQSAPLLDVQHITKRFQTAEKIAGRAGVIILMPLMFIFAATVLVMFGSLIVKGFRGQLF